MANISFVYSWIYDKEFHNLEANENSKNVVIEFLNAVKKDWESVENKVFDKLEEFSSIKWKNKKINCYVVEKSEHMPISDPLTIPIKLIVGDEEYELTKERFVDMLVHEIIHNLFIQNENLDDYFNFLIEDKYKDEDLNTAIHVPVHALHKKLFLEIFGEERMEEEIENCNYHPAYKRSWEIVNSEGEDNILEELRKKFMGHFLYMES